MIRFTILMVCALGAWFTFSYLMSFSMPVDLIGVSLIALFVTRVDRQLGP